MPFGWNENCDRLADCFLGSIAKEPLCGLIPTCDDAIEVPSLRLRFNNASEPQNLLVTFTKPNFDLLARGNVDDRGNPASYLTEPIFIGCVNNVQGTKARHL